MFGRKDVIIMKRQCFICEKTYDTRVAVSDYCKFVCTECAVFAYNFNYHISNKSTFMVYQSAVANWKIMGGVPWYYGGYKEELDAAKAAYKPIVSDWKCPECKVPMPHKTEGICIKCSVEKMLC